MTTKNHLYGVPVFLWEYYGYVLLWVQMLASYRDDQFFFPLAIAARKSAFYFQSFSLHYGMDAGLAFFEQRIKLANKLSNCTKHQIYILTIKQAVSSALVDTTFLRAFLGVSGSGRYGVYLLNLTELHLTNMVKLANLEELEKELNSHMLADMGRSVVTKNEVGSVQGNIDSLSKHYFFIPKLVSMIQNAV